MKYYLKPNNIEPNNVPFNKIVYEGISKECRDYDFEMDLEEEPNDSVEVLLGDNGVGKSLYIQIFCFVSFLCQYHKKGSNQYLNDVVKKMVELNIGVVKKQSELNDNDENDICIETSLRPSYLDIDYEEEYIKVNDDDGFVIKVPNPIRCFYCLAVGPNAKHYFEKHKILYYTNSQFPNSVNIFSEAVLSINANELDKFFLLSFNRSMLKDVGTAKIELSLNKTNPFLDLKKIWEKMFYREDLTDFSNVFMKKYDVFPQYHDMLKQFYGHEKMGNEIADAVYRQKYDFLLQKITSCSFYKIIDKWINDSRFQNVRFPSEIFELKNYTLFDLFLFKLLESKNVWISLELLVDGIKENSLNSGKQYDIMLRCLSEMFKADDDVLCFIDEPENAHHIKLQENLVVNMPINYHMILISHSPFLVRGLSKFKKKCKIKVLSRCADNAKCLMIESKKEIYQDVDDIIAEYFLYSPVIEKWNEIKTKISLDHFMSVKQFYEKINNLKGEL
jgi:hypothetical protein